MYSALEVLSQVYTAMTTLAALREMTYAPVGTAWIFNEPGPDGIELTFEWVKVSPTRWARGMEIPF